MPPWLWIRRHPENGELRAAVEAIELPHNDPSGCGHAERLMRTTTPGGKRPYQQEWHRRVTDSDQRGHRELADKALPYKLKRNNRVRGCRQANQGH